MGKHVVGKKRTLHRNEFDGVEQSCASYLVLLYLMTLFWWSMWLSKPASGNRSAETPRRQCKRTMCLPKKILFWDTDSPHLCQRICNPQGGAAPHGIQRQLRLCKEAQLLQLGLPQHRAQSVAPTTAQSSLG